MGCVLAIVSGEGMVMIKSMHLMRGEAIVNDCLGRLE